MNIPGLNTNATRLLTGLVIGVIALQCIILGGYWLLALVLLVIYFATVEYAKILHNKGFFPSLRVMLASEAMLAVIAFNRLPRVPATLARSPIATRSIVGVATQMARSVMAGRTLDRHRPRLLPPTA